uniref:Uncharacterized protein n=1 Tax=Arundo donax TaxID=35708 RepID=A0A0A9TKM7_ARUDO
MEAVAWEIQQMLRSNRDGSQASHSAPAAVRLERVERGNDAEEAHDGSDGRTCASAAFCRIGGGSTLLLPPWQPNRRIGEEELE